MSGSFWLFFSQYIFTSLFPGWPSSLWACVLKGDWHFEMPFSMVPIWLLCTLLPGSCANAAMSGTCNAWSRWQWTPFPVFQQKRDFKIFYFCDTVNYGNAHIRQSIVRRCWHMGTQDGQISEVTLHRSCIGMTWDCIVHGNSTGELLGCAAAYAKRWLLRVLFM